MQKICALIALVLFTANPSLFAQSYGLAPNPKFQSLSTAGFIVPGGKLCSFAAGTTTPLATYSDNVGTPNTNPIILDSAGRATVYIGAASYKFVLRTAGTDGTGAGATCPGGAGAGSTVYTQDNIYDTALLATLTVTRYCDQFAGATAGAKIAACIADLPATGGTADAHALEGAQTWSTCPVTGVTKPVRLILGASTVTMSVACAFPASVDVINYNTTFTGASSPPTFVGGESVIDYNGGSVKVLPLPTVSTALGVGALGAFTSGINNNCIGYSACAATTSGGSNNAMGAFALTTNTTGGRNIAIGDYALTANVSGMSNFAAGNSAMIAHVSGIENIAIGDNALSADTAGDGNVCFGTRSCWNLNGGSNNVGVGVESLVYGIPTNQTPTASFPAAPYWVGGTGWTLNTTTHVAHKDADAVTPLTYGTVQGSLDYGVGTFMLVQYTISNLTVGTVTVSLAGVTDTVRSANGSYSFSLPQALVYPGYLAFTPSNTARFDVTLVSVTEFSNVNASENTAIGTGAGYQTTTGGDNVMVGIGAMRQHTSGIKNVGVGGEVLLQNGTGSRNVAMGWDACYTGNSADANVCLGYAAGFYETGSNKLFIDNQQRASEADARTKALIYGVFDAAVANQSVTLNSQLNVTGNTVFTGTVSAGTTVVVNTSVDITGANGVRSLAMHNGGFFSVYNSSNTETWRIQALNTNDIKFNPITAGTIILGSTVAVSTFTGGTAAHVCYDASAAVANTLATCTSLRDLKDDIVPVGSALETVMQLSPKSFRFKNTSPQPMDRPVEYGFIAEDVLAVDPRLSTFYQGKLNGVSFDGVTALNTRAIQELNARLKALEAR